MGCFVVTEFLLTSVSRGPSAIAELLVEVVKFAELTELTELICVRQVRHGQKLAYFVEYLRIYWTNFRNLFTV